VLLGKWFLTFQRVTCLYVQGQKVLVCLGLSDPEDVMFKMGWGIVAGILTITCSIHLYTCPSTENILQLVQKSPNTLDFVHVKKAAV
jgi:hypothetical protein